MSQVKKTSHDHHRHPDAVTDIALDWYMRMQDGADAETSAAFDAWYARDPHHREVYDRLRRMHASPALRNATIGTRPRPKRHGWATGVGAIAAMLALAVGWQQIPAMAIYWQSDYRTAAGEQRTITLPDGSQATLNTASALAVDFRNNRRHVSLLKGEAFFNVRHDPSRPFIVSGHFSDVEVKGTAFAVRADGDEDTVVLERGRVEVNHRGAAQTAVLMPGQSVNATVDGITPVRSTSVDDELTWRQGRITFTDQPFENALAELERYYGGTVMVFNNEMEKQIVSGSYRTDDPVAAIRTLARSAGGNATIVPGGFIILR